MLLEVAPVITWQSCSWSNLRLEQLTSCSLSNLAKLLLVVAPGATWQSCSWSKFVSCSRSNPDHDPASCGCSREVAPEVAPGATPRFGRDSARFACNSAGIRRDSPAIRRGLGEIRRRFGGDSSRFAHDSSVFGGDVILAKEVSNKHFDSPKGCSDLPVV